MSRIHSPFKIVNSIFSIAHKVPLNEREFDCFVQKYFETQMEMKEAFKIGVFYEPVYAFIRNSSMTADMTRAFFYKIKTAKAEENNILNESTINISERVRCIDQKRKNRFDLEFKKLKKRARSYAKIQQSKSKNVDFNSLLIEFNIIRTNFGLDPTSSKGLDVYVEKHKGLDGFKSFLWKYGPEELLKDELLEAKAIKIKNLQELRNLQHEWSQDSCKPNGSSKDALLLQIKAARALSKNEQSKIKPGYVYVISNPAWPNWIKIGSALDVDSRLSSFQVGDPTKSYKLEYCIITEDRRTVEFAAHDFFSELRGNGEWFNADIERVKVFLKKYEKM